MLVIVVGGSFPVFAGSVHIYGGDFDLPIPKLNSDDPYISKGWMDDAVIEIPDYFTIYDLDVRITLTHTNVFDLQIFLQSPNGTTLCLNEYGIYEYFEEPNYTNTIFDDEAQLSIKEAKAPFTGRFRPIESYELSEFDDEDTYGFWRLRVYDAWDWDTGNLDSFELMITNPEPATVILLAIGAIFSLRSIDGHRRTFRRM